MENQPQLILEKSEINLNEKAVAYIRVSTTKQKELGHSIEVQKDFAKEYAKKNHWILEDDLIFIEDKPATRSYGNEINKNSLLESFSSRPEFHKLMVEAQNQNFKHLIIHSRDRLSRSLEESIILNVYFEKCKIKIHYTKEGENLNNEDEKINRLLQVILSSIAELEANNLAIRVKEGNRACLAKGLWPGGKAPLGYYRKRVLSENSKRPHSFLVKSDFESKIVKKVFEYYLQGLGYKNIAYKMNEEFAFIHWTKSKVESIIKNQSYTGKIAWDRRGGRRSGKIHEEIYLSPLNKDNIIVEQSIWDSIKGIRKERCETRDAFYYNTPFIFKGKLVCAKCNKFMKPKNPGKNKTKVYKCAHTKDDRNQCNCIIPAHAIEEEFIKYMKNIFKIKDYEYFWSIYNDEFTKRISEYKNNMNSINEKLIECNNTLNKLKIFIQNEENRQIVKALETQHKFYYKLINEYKHTKDLLEKKHNTQKLSKEVLTNLINKSIPSIFIKDDAINDENMKIKQRAFINLFINKIFVDYNSITKQIQSIKIEILPSEFI